MQVCKVSKQSNVITSEPKVYINNVRYKSFLFNNLDDPKINCGILCGLPNSEVALKIFARRCASEKHEILLHLAAKVYFVIYSLSIYLYIQFDTGKIQVLTKRAANQPSVHLSL